MREQYLLKYAVGCFICLLWFVSISAQEPHFPPRNLSTVYIYRLDQGNVFWTLVMKTSPVYFGQADNQKIKRQNIAGLRNKHFLIMYLPPGKYQFDTRLMPKELTLNVQSGQTYYLRLDRGNDCNKELNDTISPCVDKNASIEQVSAEDWRTEHIGLMPIKLKVVRDKNRVIIPTQ